MKSIAIYLVGFLVCISCTEEDKIPTGPINDTFDPTGATVIKSGMLMGIGGHTVMGTTTIYSKNNTLTLVLDPFTSQNGPDLRVYLSKDTNAGSFLSLGLLKSVTGKQSYTIPGNPNLNEYTYVHVWCQQFSVQFGRAELTE